MSLTRSEQGYENRRRQLVWHSLVPDRYPASIDAPSDSASVARVVRKARESGARIALRSGGHSWIGSGLRDGGVLIDLGNLCDIVVDRESMKVQVGPGATHKMLADVLVGFGLAFPIGHCQSVGLGGYLLAGGMGWNLREWGPGCWNVSGADVVTAAGDIIRVDESNKPDLLWALRGAGPGFPGVVTSFFLETYPLPRIATRHVTFKLAALPDVLGSIAERLGESLAGIEVSLIARPALPDLALEPRVVVAITTFGETADDAQTKMTQSTEWVTGDPPPLSDTGPVPASFAALEGEGGWSRDLRYAADTRWIGPRFRELAELVVEHLMLAPSSRSRVVLAFGFLPQREIDVAFTCMGTLTANVYAAWSRPSEDMVNRSWLRGFISDLAPLSQGAYIGEADTTAISPRSAFPMRKLAKLKRIVSEYDPDQVFHGFLVNDDG